jgi:tetratricopeptide (TPR) repeat protein
VLKLLPDAPERTHHELALHLALGRSLMMSKGYADPEVERVYTRARALCHRVGHTPLLFPALTGLTTYYIARAEFHRARELAAQCLHLAQQMPRVSRHLHARSLLGMTLFYLGEFPAAHEYLTQGITGYDMQRLCSGSPVREAGLVLSCLSYAAVTLWALGYPEQALQRSQEAVAFARKLARPASLATALHVASWIHQDRREVQGAQERAAALMALCREQEFPFWLAWGQTHQGWVLAEQGQVADGILQMRQGLAAVRAAGAEGGLSDTLGLLVSAAK